jgi:hypothetical protein
MVKCKTCKKEVKDFKKEDFNHRFADECKECHLKRFKEQRKYEIKKFIEKNIQEVSREWNYRNLSIDEDLNISTSTSKIVRSSDSGLAYNSPHPDSAQRYYLCKCCNNQLFSEEELYKHLQKKHIKF